MAQLRPTERPVIEYTLSTSTEAEAKWIKAYGRTELADISALFTEAQRTQDQSQLVYVITARLLVDWSWQIGEEKAPISPETVALLDPVDFLEIVDQLDVNDVLTRVMSYGESKSKKKNSSATSSTSRKPVKAKR